MAEDLTNLDGLLEELEARRAKARGMGGPEKLERRRKAGVMNARERVDYLVDKGSFIETGLLGVSGVYPQDRDRTPTDGKITGFAKIDGRDIAVAVNDFTVMGSSTSATNSKKVGHVRRLSARPDTIISVMSWSMSSASIPSARQAEMAALLPVPAKQSNTNPDASNALQSPSVAAQ